MQPETVRPEVAAWQRHRVHEGATLLHLQNSLRLPEDAAHPYKVAWVHACVLFDAAKLWAAGGFTFWQRYGPDHVADDILVQLRVMERFGGCGVAPSGAYHLGVPSTLPSLQALRSSRA